MMEAGSRNVAADREVILNSCRSDLRYDHQCEECRDGYLFDVLHATGEPDFYADRIGEILQGTDESDESLAWHQLIEIAARFVRMGHANLRPILYGCVARLLAVGGDAGTTTIIRLDGARGYHFILEQVAHLPPAEDAWTEEWLLSELIESIGEGAAEQLSQRLSTKSPAFKAYLERVWCERKQSKQERERRDAESKSHRNPVDYAAAMAWVDAPPGTSVTPSAYGISRDMDEATARRVAADLRAETQPTRLTRFLRLFWRRPFPLDVAPLLRHARSDDKKLSWCTLRALKLVCDLAVRAYAFEIADTQDGRYLAPMLLINNPGANDLDLFRDLLDRPFDDFGLHRMGISLREYFETNPTVDATDCFLKLYERGPCSMCRGSVVKMLLARSALPDALRRECLYDADTGTREMIFRNIRIRSQ